MDLLLQGLFSCLSEEFIAFAEPPSVSLGRWVSARLQEEPPSLCTEREGDQEFPWLFCVPLAHEGLFVEPPSGASLGRGVLAYL